MVLDYVIYVQAESIYKDLVSRRIAKASELALAAADNDSDAQGLGTEWLLLDELIKKIEEDEKRPLMQPHQRPIKKRKENNLMPPVYDLKSKYATLLAKAEDMEIDPIVLHDTLESIKDAIEDKAVGCVQVIKSLEADVDSIDQEIKRLQERKKSYQNNIARLKLSLVDAMNTTGQQKIKTPLWTIWVQKTASVNVMNNDPKKVQTDFVKIETVYKVDKQAALKKLKAGEKIVGLQLRYSESLRTR